MRTLCTSLATASTPGSTGHARGVGAPPPRAGPASPSWCCATAADWPRSCCRPAPSYLPRRRRCGSPAPPRPTRRPPAAWRSPTPVVEPLTEPALTPAVELWRPSLDASLPTLLDHAPVLWRHPAQRARWELAAASLRGFRSTLDGLGFTEVATPKLVESATESGANVFPVDYFGRPAYLAQSPQFFKQQLVGCLRAGLRGGPGLPRRAARHRAAPRRVPLPRRRARLHRGPPRRAAPCCARCWPGWSPRSPRRRRGGAYGRPAAGRARGDPRHPLRRRARPRRRTGRRARPGSRARARARGVGDRRARVATSRRRGLPDGEAAVLHPSLDEGRAGRRALVQQLRPALPRARAGDGRAAAAPALGLRARPSARAARTRRRTTSYLQAFRHGMPPHGGFAIGLERWVAGWWRRPTSAR